MPQMIEGKPHRQKRRLEGVVPPGLFVSELTSGNRRVGTLLATAQLWRLAQDFLGLSRMRLWIILGGSPGISWHPGNIQRLSQLYMSRLLFLYHLKAHMGLNTNAIYQIDWEKGIMYLDPGQPLQLGRPKEESKARELLKV